MRWIVWAFALAAGCGGCGGTTGNGAADGGDAAAGSTGHKFLDASSTRVDASIDDNDDAGGAPEDAGTTPEAGAIPDRGSRACNPDPTIPEGGVCAGNCPWVTVDNSEPTGIAVYDGNAYLSTQSNVIAMCNLPGCSTTFQLVSGGAVHGAAYGVSLGSSAIYWIQENGEIWTAELSGANAHVIATIGADAGDLSPDETALAGNRLYFDLIPGGLMSCDVGNCAGTKALLAPPGGSDDAVNGIATDGVSLFWTSMDDAWVVESDLDGGNPQMLATDLDPPPGALAVDACNLYWVGWTPLSAQTIDVVTCRRSACAATLRVFAVLQTRPEFATIALDDANVYLLARDSQQLFVLPKP